MKEGTKERTDFMSGGALEEFGVVLLIVDWALTDQIGLGRLLKKGESESLGKWFMAWH